MASPTLRSYRPGDEKGIRELFQMCHNRELSPDLWNWRYQKLPAGAAVVDVAEDQGRIVAHLGTLPFKMSHGKETFLGGLWVDLMVHPDYRNLTLFLDLAEANRRNAEGAGIRMLYAFPNDRSYPVLKRMLGWESIEEINALEAPLDTIVAKIRSNIDPHPTLSLKGEGFGTASKKITEHSTNVVTKIDHFGKEFDLFWESIRPAEAWTVVRDSAWLNWRYHKPGENYAVWSASDGSGKLSGWLAAKIFRGETGVIGDILDFWTLPAGKDSDSGRTISGLLWRTAVEYFKSKKVATVSAWATKDTALFKQYVSLGLRPEGPRTHFAGRWSASDESGAFPSLGREWYITKGDSDVF